MKYQVTIKETNEYMYFVESNSEEEAEEKAFREHDQDRENWDLECYDSSTDVDVILMQDD